MTASGESAKTKAIVSSVFTDMVVFTGMVVFTVMGIHWYGYSLVWVFTDMG